MKYLWLKPFVVDKVYPNSVIFELAFYNSLK